jgi:hypothetical protein
MRIACLAFLVVTLSWAAAAPIAHASTPATPQSWLAATCGAISALQHHSERATTSRATLKALLGMSTVDGKTLLAATGSAPRALPHGDAIAALLHGQAATFLRYVAAHRSSGTTNAALARALAARTKAIGATFVHLARSYPSTELDAAIDQSPTCALVHG